MQSHSWEKVGLPARRALALFASAIFLAELPTLLLTLFSYFPRAQYICPYKCTPGGKENQFFYFFFYYVREIDRGAFSAFLLIFIL
jgi:hypothetical protein